MKLNASVFSFAAIATSLITSTSIANAQAVAPATLSRPSLAVGTSGTPQSAPTAPSVDAEVPIARRLTVTLDETFFTRAHAPENGHGSFAYYSTSTIVGLEYRFSRLRLEAQAPFAISDTKNGTADNSASAIGNPSAGAYYTFETPRAHFEIGALLTIPVGTEDALSTQAQRGAVGARGFDRVWLWNPRTTTVAPAISVGSHEESAFQHRAEVVLAPLFSHEPTELILQASEDVGFRASHFRAGARVEIVADLIALKVEPELSITPHVGLAGASGFVDLGFLVNLTPPAGFSFDDTKYWGLNLRGGLHF